MKHDVIRVDEIKDELQAKYGYIVDMDSFTNAIDALQGHFVSKEEEYQKYCHIDIVNNDNAGMLRRMMGFAERLQHMEFNRQVDDIIEVGLRRYEEKYHNRRNEECPFVLYEKYSRRDVSLLMNCGRDLSSTMYGMKRIGEDVCTATRKHLLVKKSDAETNFYYMGMFDVIDVKADTKKDNNGKDRDIAKVTMQMKHSVRDDLLRYLQSNIQSEGEKAV